MKIMNRPDAEDVNYWKTSRLSPDTWLTRAEKLIAERGGRVMLRGLGADHAIEAYFMTFELGGDMYKILWPVLHSRTGAVMPQRIQAATMLYHDVKAKCIAAVVLGDRAAFFSYMLLPDGRTAAEIDNQELGGVLSMIAPRQRWLEIEGEIVDEGE